MPRPTVLVERSLRALFRLSILASKPARAAALTSTSLDGTTGSKRVHQTLRKLVELSPARTRFFRHEARPLLIRG